MQVQWHDTFGLFVFALFGVVWVMAKIVTVFQML